MLGLAVGLIKGGLWLLCWVGAFFATVYGFEYIAPVATEMLKAQGIIESEWLANIAVGAGIFLVVLIFLFVVSSALSGWVRGSRLNILDRSLGFVVGILAALVLVSAAYIPFSSSWSEAEEQPSWFRDARLRPVIQWGAKMVRNVLPEEFGGERETAGADEDAERALEAERAAQELSNPRPKGSGGEAEEGYESRERRDLDRLLQATQER